VSNNGESIGKSGEKARQVDETADKIDVGEEGEKEKNKTLKKKGKEQNRRFFRGYND